MAGLPLVEQSPGPPHVYFKREDAIKDGKMSLPVSMIKEKNRPPCSYSRLRSCSRTCMISGKYTPIILYLKPPYATTIQKVPPFASSTRVYLLCEGTAIWIPLCTKGCVSTLDLYFTYFYTTGKREWTCRPLASTSLNM